MMPILRKAVVEDSEVVKHIMHHQHEAPNKPRNLDDYFTNHQILCKISTQKFLDVNQQIDRMISCLKGDAYPGTNETLSDVVWSNLPLTTSFCVFP